MVLTLGVTDGASVGIKVGAIKVGVTEIGIDGVIVGVPLGSCGTTVLGSNDGDVVGELEVLTLG
jgi:hypothetical protein